MACFLRSLRALSRTRAFSRLSAFLWTSLPDQELFDLAARRELNNSKTLVAQAKRMLADPKAERFIEHFVRQWLGMDLLEYLEVDKKASDIIVSRLKSAKRDGFPEVEVESACIIVLIGLS